MDLLLGDNTVIQFKKQKWDHNVHQIQSDIR